MNPGVVLTAGIWKAYTWSATRGVVESLNGEAFDVDQVLPFWERLRSWHV